MLRLCLFITLIVVVAPAFSQQVDEILEPYFEAVGGKEKIGQIRTSRVWMNGEYFPQALSKEVDPSYKQPPPSNMELITKLPCYQFVTAYDQKGNPDIYFLTNDKGRQSVFNVYVTPLRKEKNPCLSTPRWSIC
ncbi:MAG: hypothetical protein WDO15_15280 [Bacteroidota bacterium]